MIIFLLFGMGRPTDAKVLRPIMTGWPEVFCRKNFKSVGIFQTSVLFFPNSLFLPMAAMSEIIILYGNRRLNGVVRVIIDKLKIFNHKILNFFLGRVDFHFWHRADVVSAGELKFGLFQMVGI